MVACLIDPDAEVCYAPETWRSIGYNPTPGNCRRSLKIPLKALRAARRRGMSRSSLDGRGDGSNDWTVHVRSCCVRGGRIFVFDGQAWAIALSTWTCSSHHYSKASGDALGDRK